MALSTPTLRTIQEAQRALLAPLRRESIDAWLQDVVGSVQSVMGADHAYAVLPDAEVLRVAASDVDDGFCDGLRDSITGMEDGVFLFDDPMPLQMHLYRRRRGSGAYHELEMLDRPTIEASPLFRELFFPFGIRYAVGLSVFLPKGEAMICVGFESPDADGYDPAALKRLELLVPAFESAVDRGVDPTTAASTLESTLTELRRDDVPVENLTEETVLAVLELVEDGELAKEGIGPVLTELADDSTLSAEDAIEAAGLSGVDRAAVRETVVEVIERNEKQVETEGMGAFSALMGECMGALRGKADGEVVSELLREEIGKRT